MILRSTIWSQHAYNWRQSSELTFKVIQGHRLLLQPKAHIWLPISDLLLPKLYLTPFPRYSIAKLETDLPQFEPPDQGDPLQIS